VTDKEQMVTEPFTGTAHNPIHGIRPSRVPIQILEVELAPSGGGPASAHPPVETDRPVVARPTLALVRSGGRPLGLVHAEADDPAELVAAIAATARETLPSPATESRAGRAPSAEPPLISVVIATRERPEMLAKCLTAVRALDYPRYEVVVVDNAPVTEDTAVMVKTRFPEVRYVREPRKGLALAHNRALAETGGEIIAFTDDDVVVDRHWLTAVADGFGCADRVGCVTGLIVPAELETRAQAMLERHGGFAKGFQRRVLSLDEPGDDPLFPFAAGKFGSGANMAFDAALLKSLGGFDPATGAGTYARGGDDLLAFFRTITAGYRLVYEPGAVTWHHHRRTDDDLSGQIFGYGVGLGAFLTAAVVTEPRMLPRLIRRVPRGIAYALARAAAHRGDPAPDEEPWPRRLAFQEWFGLLNGPFRYARSRAQSKSMGGR
jgi:GT2 family glycosyltransferase